MAELTLLPPTSRFIFQGGQVACKTASGAFRQVLSEQPCRANAADGRAALWLGPDEYLLLAPLGDARTIATELTTALAGIPHSLVDISQRQVAWRLGGPDADAILNSGCPLDLDPAEFPPGMCTRTLFGKAQIVLWRKAPEEYHLDVWRSYSDYVRELLLDAARSEFADRISGGDDHAQRSGV
ncbi:MAG: sarcosine oxidase subunit gamma [Steroidobacteraceae bacterium]